MNGELAELFKSLSSMPDQIKSTDVDLLGSFLMKVYQQISKRVISLDIFRMNQFCKWTSFNPHNLILSRKGLLEHTKRAALQAGWIWKECEFNLCKNIFARLFSVHNTICLSRHEQVCLMRLHFERYLMMGELSLET